MVRLWGGVLLPMLLLTGTVDAQPLTPGELPTRPPVSSKEPEVPLPIPASSLDAPDEPSLAYAAVGYIDNPILQNTLRFRYDSAYRSNRPARAEYIYARGKPFGPGLPLPESSIDFQETTLYAEFLLSRRISVFVEGGYHWLNPEINRNADGIGDGNAGVRFGLWDDPERTFTFQLRTYFPSGNANLGLGNAHASIEPAFLYRHQITPDWNVTGEFRYWTAIGGTDFAGDFFRYGVGVSYGQRRNNGLWLMPVAEVVGWTVLNGRSGSFFPGSPGLVEDAEGDTIVNLKLGARFGLGSRMDVYAGWGRALTGDVWYKDLVRVEMNYRF